jgi:hypothetical protein
MNASTEEVNNLHQKHHQQSEKGEKWENPLPFTDK